MITEKSYNITDIYASSSCLEMLTKEVGASDNAKIHIKGLQGASALFYLHAFAQKNPHTHHILIMDNAEAAAYCYNTLQHLCTTSALFYFPSSFKSKKNYSLLNPSYCMYRAEALNYLTSPAHLPIILVSYPEALFEKVTERATLSSNILHIKRNEIVHWSDVVQWLDKQHFQSVEFVYAPGQYACRGGLIDIYSYHQNQPYRVEWNDYIIESIRSFDPETQLSIKKFDFVSIVPHHTSYGTNRESIMQFLQPLGKWVLWMKNCQYFIQMIQQQIEWLQLFIAQSAMMDEQHAIEPVAVLHQPLTLLDVTDGLWWETQMATLPVIEIGTHHYAQGTSILVKQEAQPLFNKQFNVLLDNIKQYSGQSYRIYIFSDQVKQLERIEAILKNMDAEFFFIQMHYSLHEGFVDHDNKMLCYTDHQIFNRYHKYTIKQVNSHVKTLTLKSIRELQPGDFITHIDHGIGIFSGLQKIEQNGQINEVVRLIYKDQDVLYVNIHSLHKITKYTGKEGAVPTLHRLGGSAWVALKEKTTKKVKEIAIDLIRLYAERKAQEGFAHSPDGYLQIALESSFLYEETPDQTTSMLAIKKDMEKPIPMDRLVCGDVGFGKTELAIRAAFKTCVDGKQAVILVPTTILALQHYQTFKERLKDFPVQVDYLNRFRTAKEKKRIYEEVSNGKINIIIATHALLNKQVKFHQLGLLVIDEEQKFGVAHKEKIKEIKTTVDCLTLTATPIPRTLQFSLMGARDLNIIQTPPSNRQPIQTEVVLFDEEMVRDAIYYEVEREGQVFFVHNRIQGLIEMKDKLSSLCPDISFTIAHGQLEGDELEERIVSFINKKYDVLVCTNIIESGVDISNVNTIFVYNAHQFGLSDLHQLRGRVGRSNKKAFCYLVAPSMTLIPSDAKKRLEILEQFSDLGSGFQIAMRDLDMRGAGNVIGAEQTGFMADMGFETYQKILHEAIKELKRDTFKHLFKDEIIEQDSFVHDCSIETDWTIAIPDSYIVSVSERLLVYTQISQCKSDEEIGTLQQQLIDRFGKLPEAVFVLCKVVQCRKIAKNIGFEKISIKDKNARCFFIPKHDSPYFDTPIFKKILQFIQTKTHQAVLKQQQMLFFIFIKQIYSIDDLLKFLLTLEAFVCEKIQIKKI